jgi:hypothetical protein
MVIWVVMPCLIEKQQPCHLLLFVLAWFNHQPWRWSNILTQNVRLAPNYTKLWCRRIQNAYMKNVCVA